MKTILLVSCALGLLTVATIASASPACGVAPEVQSRGEYDPFRVRTDHDSPIDFEARAKSSVDIVVRKHEYASGGYTGWHKHPGPVFITVVEGTLTFYESDDPSCTGKVVNAGEGYVDNGHGHYGIASNGPAVDVSVILAPVGLPFREEIPPSPYCSLPPPCPF